MDTLLYTNLTAIVVVFTAIGLACVAAALIPFRRGAVRSDPEPVILPNWLPQPTEPVQRYNGSLKILVLPAVFWLTPAMIALLPERLASVAFVTGLLLVGLISSLVLFIAAALIWSRMRARAIAFATVGALTSVAWYGTVELTMNAE